MKVTCIREGLLTACQLVGVAVAARTTKPILSNVKAVAHDDALTLMGTDLEVGIRYELRGVKVGRAGSADFRQEPMPRGSRTTRELGREARSPSHDRRTIRFRAGAGCRSKTRGP